MISTAEEAMAEISKRGFPAVFSQVYENRIPLVLCGSLSTPARYFEILPALVQALPASEKFLPLWETNREEVVAYDLANDCYVRYRYGDGQDEILGRTYQQFVSAFLLELVDSGVWDELDDVAGMFQYKHTDRLRKFVESCDDSDFEGSNRRFVDSIID